MNHSTTKRTPTYSELMHNGILFSVSHDKRVQTFVHRNREYVATQTPRGWIVREVAQNTQPAGTVSDPFGLMVGAR